MWEKRYSEELIARREKAVQGGGAKRIEKQHQAGKLTARHPDAKWGFRDDLMMVSREESGSCRTAC